MKTDDEFEPHGRSEIILGATHEGMIHVKTRFLKPNHALAQTKRPKLASNGDPGFGQKSAFFETTAYQQLDTKHEIEQC